MADLSYLSEKTIKKESATHGTGLYAQGDLKKGEIIAVKGGYIMPRSEWLAIEEKVGFAAEIQISENLVIAPRKKEEARGCMMALNHSCAPNVGVLGSITYITMRDIKPGEELCLDYAMIDDFEGSMNCSCGAKECRRVISGKDWQKHELQKKYKGYFAAFIAKKITDESY